MANHLKMAQIHAIQALLQRGWSNRKIARELGVHRETVARYAKQFEAAQNRPNPTAGSSPSALQNRPNPPLGSGPPAPQNRPNLPPGSNGPPSHCEPYRKRIEEDWKNGLSAQRIYQDLRAEYDFPGSYSSVKRFVRRLGRQMPLPVRRMEIEPGQEAQIDFGAGAWTLDGDGKRKKRPHLFRVILSHSGKGYSEVVWQQTTESFLRALENAFRHFGGVPALLVIDNLKAAVKKADWYDPELHPKIASFARHYGTVFAPTRPYTPRHKGKVERGIGYCQDNALKGRTFSSLAEQNRHVLEWETRIADTRIHGTTRKQVGQVFESTERPALQPLPTEAFPFFKEGRRRVHYDAHVEVDRAYYSVPPEYLRHTVWVRWDSRIVRVFNARLEAIAVHTKVEPGRFQTAEGHLATEKISAVERGAEHLLKRAAKIGEQTHGWAQEVLEVRGLQGFRVVVGLLSLTGHYRGAALEKACQLARSHGSYHLRSIRELLKRRVEQQTFSFLEEHPIYRELSAYGQLIDPHGVQQHQEQEWQDAVQATQTTQQEEAS